MKKNIKLNIFISVLFVCIFISIVVFDKTGTLTYGKIKINEINNYSKYSKGDLLNIISNKVLPIFMNYASSELRNITTTLINRAISKHISNLEEVEDMIIITRGEDNEKIS